MRYKRNEAFRFSFDHPIDGQFSIYEINGKELRTGEGKMKVLDLSPSGARIQSGLSIPFTENQSIKILLHFYLNDSFMIFRGKIVWGKTDNHINTYGVQFLNNENLQEEIIRQLKVYVKEQ
ncbi:PilZ domain-containing protein [Jeotgalibacillus proteolyticus]|uniref:PilZ domain-containing protein n=1 Tax=Jeotgalibacillus proteolyticus TaxID=2082395 RepID=A0A2S5GAX5_9BACL|nr:PilZ domain-containing protein [Jeotgalibacillus proteolyticus]PPA70140.1 hypothetical protein C4B60_11165 [Jeotgalibacillus proteolyticus]